MPPVRLRTRRINGYGCESAHRRACLLAAKPRTACKLVVVGNTLWQLVYSGLAQGLSPQQVSGTLARMEPPQRISHESIYSAIYAMPIGELRKEVIALLRKHHKGRRPRTAGKDRRQLIIGMTSIEERPLSVEDRLVPGHWEGDLAARATSPRTRARWAVGANRTARKKARATPSAATSIWPGPLLRRRTSRCATTLRSNAGTCLPTHAPENTGRPWAGLTTSTATASCLATACR